MKYTTEIRFCEIKSGSFHKKIEAINVTFHGKSWNEYKTTKYTSINGKLNNGECVDGRSKKRFPCVACVFSKECEAQIISISYPPLCLFEETETI